MSTPESQLEQYKFDSQLEVGTTGANEAVSYLSKWYNWYPATQQDERNGIDGILECRKTKRRWATEIKTDWTAGRTSNVFIETVSVDKEGILGWAYTSLAQLLVYYIPSLRRVYIASMAAIKAQLCEWKNQYETKKIPNNGRYGTYNTEGLLIPFAVFERDCECIIRELA